jgi:ferredoxin
MEMDINLYDKCSRESNDRARQKEQEREAAANRWQSILNSALSNGIPIETL